MRSPVISYDNMNILLDTGSDRTFVATHSRRKTKLKNAQVIGKTSMKLSTLNGITNNISVSILAFTLEGIKIQAHQVPTIGKVEGQDIDILLGVDYLWHFINSVKVHKEGLALIRTRLGDVVSQGRSVGEEAVTYKVSNVGLDSTLNRLILLDLTQVDSPEATDNS